MEIVQSEGFDKAACKLGLGGVVELRPDAIPGVTSDYEHETGPGFFTVVHTEPAFVFLIHCESKKPAALVFGIIVDLSINLQKDLYCISHHTLNVSLHYLVKYK